MTIKVINKPLLDRDHWYFPEADINTMDWYFDKGLIDVDPALKMAAPYLNGYRTVIQAGGAVGIWPVRLSQVFNNVITFEPEAVNHECLVRNTSGIENITIHNAALGKVNKKVRMVLEPSMIGHCGAFQVKDGGEIDVLRIDDLNVKDVDMIYLDIEGSEYDAIAGAAQTIDRYKPVIGIEEKGFNRRYNNGATPHELLQKMGYKSIGKPNKDDVLFVPENWNNFKEDIEVYKRILNELGWRIQNQGTINKEDWEAIVLPKLIELNNKTDEL